VLVVSDFRRKNNMEMPHPAFRCRPIRFSVALQTPLLNRGIFGMRNSKTKAATDQQVDA
jgi:hypothetical protein